MILWASILHGPTGNDTEAHDFQGDWFEASPTDPVSSLATLESLSKAL